MPYEILVYIVILFCLCVPVNHCQRGMCVCSGAAGRRWPSLSLPCCVHHHGAWCAPAQRLQAGVLLEAFPADCLGGAEAETRLLRPAVCLCAPAGVISDTMAIGRHRDPPVPAEGAGWSLCRCCFWCAHAGCRCHPSGIGMVYGTQDRSGAKAACCQ